jgi:hypothetical protein
MKRIIIDFFTTSPFILVDEEGKTIYFETYEKAIDYARKELHDGMYRIIDVPVNFI